MIWPTETVYIACATVGGAVLTIQMVLLFFGGDIDDFDADGADGGDGTSLLSIRSMAGFLALFGLFGWWGTDQEWGAGRTLASALGAGVGTALCVAWMAAAFRGLESEGNVDPKNALGKPARVYLKVPAERAGKGKVTVSIQGRSRQYDAVTAGPELPTGDDVRIVGMTTENTFEVSTLESPQTNHAEEKGRS